MKVLSNAGRLMEKVSGIAHYISHTHIITDSPATHTYNKHIQIHTIQDYSEKRNPISSLCTNSITFCHTPHLDQHSVKTEKHQIVPVVPCDSVTHSHFSLLDSPDDKTVMKSVEQCAVQHHDGSNKYSNESSQMHKRVDADLGGGSKLWSGVDHACTHNLTLINPPGGVFTYPNPAQPNPTQPNPQQHNTFNTHIVNTLQLPRNAAEFNQQQSSQFK